MSRRPTKKTASKTTSSKKTPPAGPAEPTVDTGTEAASDPRQRARLDRLRTKIDEIDHQLVKLLNDRAKTVVQVGKVKQGSGIPIYAPHREAEVLARVLGHNKGPLPDRSVEGVYKELMSGSFAIE
ncbi:MAG: chorismate mutase, partial [Planctomycetota bacterium]